MPSSADHHNRTLGCLLVVAAVLLPTVPVEAAAPSFRNEVMAVLSKAGCNQGTCHGNQNGKNGFKLSLRGEDPDFDYGVLTRDMLGRRSNPYRPEDSLLLLKATAVVPHEGGRRFGREMPEFDILRRWLAAGMPADEPQTPVARTLSVTPVSQVLVEPAAQVQLQVRAVFSDGAERDVTRLAVFEPVNLAVSVTPDGLVRRESWGESAILVRYLDQRATVQLALVPARPTFHWSERPETSYIDRHVFAKLRTLRMVPAPACPDHVFLRRAYLDALGVMPTAEETRVFLSDQRSDKRARLLDRLLERPEFADFWALKWSDVLHNEEKTLDAKGVAVFHRWIRDSIAQGKPLNEFARELIAARGSTYRQPAANLYRALREPESRAEAVAQVFLGVRLQCARCHNHPFDRWTQNDYYSQAAFFARIQYEILENQRTDQLDKHEFIGEQIVWQDREGEELHPKTGEPVPPRFLDAAAPAAVGSDRLQAFADWIARPDNPFFARTQANRIWYHLLGRGLVEPNDDFRATNPPSHPALLDELARDLAAHHFDLRHLVRTIMNSQTYQLAATSNETNADDDVNYAHAQLRPLQAEQLLDAVSQVTGVPARFNGFPVGLRAGALPGLRGVGSRRVYPTRAEKFLRQFGKPERFLSCDCERSDDTTLGRAFQLISGEMINDMLSAPENRLGKLLAAGKNESEIIDEFYHASLCRPPAAKEREAALAFVAARKDRRAALEDLLWGLLNSKEFLLRP